jgi:hypothetical protein
MPRLLKGGNRFAIGGECVLRSNVVHEYETILPCDRRH